jgi:hypothetical protein
MSVLTYFVVAQPRDAKEIGDDFLSKKFVWHDLSGMDVSALDALHSELSGNPASKMFTPTEDILPLLYEQDSQECWVYQIPADWLNLIAEIDAKAAPALTKCMIKKSWNLKSWHAHGGVDIPSFENHLIRLRDLSKEAIKKKSSVLYRVSL